MKKEVIVEVKQMNKRFGSTIALNNVDIAINRGEILGLIGENGSGKSTVTSIVSGMQRADSGEMLYKGKSWNPDTMIHALNQGIGMIVQENGTVAGISVAENIFLGELDQFKSIHKGRGYGFVNRKELNRKAQEVLNQIGASYIKADRITGALDLQDRKLIEIAKVMQKNPEVLVVDETTTALSQNGRTIIYNLMNKMVKENKAVVFISHDLDEIMNVCNRLTVLRDGKIIRTFDKEEFDEELIKTSMIGRELEGDYYRSDYNGSYNSEVVLELEDINVAGELKNFNLQLHKGEILGIGGLSHCGMHTLGKVMFGAVKPASGNVLIHKQILKNEAEAMKRKVGYVAKDRDTESLCLNASIKENIAIGGLDTIAHKNILVLSGAEKQYVDEQINLLQIKCQNRNQYVSALSGGNKQKVVFGKWIGRGSEILILDCPTRGVDIGVKQAMYQLMYDMKKEGKSIVIISEEMTELIGMADRLVVMKDGEIKKEFPRKKELSESDIIEYMI
ncbi:sugar ABC transporter ATP-binding protein [Anaerosporobacter sp.]|uniref:sugar ABC transporter ATP-binding protein n=1 Tax=Anaerosporobacter sp. TaxID=1872529 RepID=UPI00286F6EC0|nr:sugar ABC transporter ATP-binding protein [Anaerosporobacter sp.]